MAPNQAAQAAARRKEEQQIALRPRRLRDIAELVENPYPGIKLHVHDDAINHPCLILSPKGERSLHLRVDLPDNYPLSPPSVTIQSNVVHPNIFGSYICASILNTEVDYTPAYTLKAICIQLLSFFSSDNIEQSYGGPTIGRKEYAEEYAAVYGRYKDARIHICNDCGFGVSGAPSTVSQQNQKSNAVAPLPSSDGCPIANVDWDVLLMICDNLENDQLAIAARAWKPFREALHALVPMRNRQCFTLKKGARDVNLGVGVHVTNKKMLQCEFDMVSQEAFEKLGVRRSIMGLSFEHWLPLPITEKHWDRVKGELLENSLSNIGKALMTNATPIKMVYTFMNDVVVNLSSTTASMHSSKSTLTQVSEKAVESYFALFHLLVCMAVNNKAYVDSAHDLVKDFKAGKDDKIAVPNLGHLVIARLLQDADNAAEAEDEEKAQVETRSLSKSIIMEAVTRNVVWMLSDRNLGLAGLAYIEPSAVSDYRLKNTYRASVTSYRLLMFQDLMRRTVLDAYPRMTLVQIKAELFKRHGAPPEGAASRLAEAIKGIQRVANFPDFLGNMRLPVPTGENFTDFLRRSVKGSMAKGYSVQGITQEEALYLRRQKEPKVEVVEGMEAAFHHGKNISFFPGESRRGGRGGGQRRR